MKKILLATLVSLPFWSIGQSLQLSDTWIENEGTIYKGRATVTNISETAVDVVVKREILEKVPEHDAYFCWGSCYGPATSVSPSAKSIPAGGSDAESFYGDLETNGYCGLTRVKYTFYLKNDPTDKVEHTYVYDIWCGAAGVAANQSNGEVISNMFPNPIQSIGTLNYDLSSKNFSEANLIVRNLTGAIVKNIKLTEEKGEVSLNVNDLNNGIYMYSLVLDGKAILTKKLTVVGQ